MTISTLATLILYVGGVTAVIIGLRSARRPPKLRVVPESRLRRDARVARIDDFRNRRFEEPHPLPQWKRDDDPGPTTA